LLFGQLRLTLIMHKRLNAQMDLGPYAGNQMQTALFLMISLASACQCDADQIPIVLITTAPGKKIQSVEADWRSRTGDAGAIATRGVEENA